jgi:hypothetical protein
MCQSCPKVVADLNKHVKRRPQWTPGPLDEVPHIPSYRPSSLLFWIRRRLKLTFRF